LCDAATSALGHFRTKSPLIIARIYWSRPPTGADVSGALGKGRRVRLVFFSRAHHPTASRRCRRLVAVGSDNESSASAKAQGDVQEGRRARQAPGHSGGENARAGLLTAPGWGWGHSAEPESFTLKEGKTHPGVQEQRDGVPDDELENDPAPVWRPCTGLSAGRTIEAPQGG
jgi:hypothetical protein